MQAENYIEEVKRLARILDESGIAYLTTGAAAVVIYGVPRTSMDIDIAVKGVERRRLVEVLERGGYRFNAESMKYEQLLEFESPAGTRIDIWLTPPIRWEEESFEHRKRHLIHGEPVYFISAEDLIVRKLWRYRRQRIPTDLEDVRGILATTTELDREYLDGMTRVTRTATLFRELVAEARRVMNMRGYRTNDNK